MTAVTVFLDRLAREPRGAVTVLAAIAMLAVMAVAALAVDMGSVYQDSRRMQGMADAAALAAAGNLPTASTAARQAIDAAGWPRTVNPEVATGTYTADPARPVAQRFVPGGARPNAAKVTLTSDAPTFFGRMLGIDHVRIIRAATAARLDMAAFSIGSRLATLDGGVANALLGGLTGTTVSLSAADYQALLDADVDLFDYVAALKTEMHATGGSFDSLLATAVPLPRALAALATTLSAGGSGRAAAAVAALADGGGGSLVPAALIGLGPIGGQDRAGDGGGVRIGAYTLLQALVQAGGKHQVSLDLASAVPGLSTATATIQFGEHMQNSPWIAVTDTGAPIVSTAQTRILIEATIPGGSALAALNVAKVRLPVYVDLAAAQARLSSLACSQRAREAVIEVQPSLGHIAIADVKPADLAGLAAPAPEAAGGFVDLVNIASVSGSARFDASGGWQTLPFSTTEVDAQATKPVVSQAGTTSVAALVASLQPVATIGPLRSASPSTAALVKPLLAILAPLVDTLTGKLLDLLGVRLAQADVRIDGVRCGTASLVA